MKYIINRSNNPGYNLAFEEYCFKRLPRGGKYIFFWINKPAIIVGKNQNTIEEINQDFIEENDIEVIRRITGGGAVYHDYGNLNFTIITEETSNSKIDFKEYNKSIIEALKKLNIDAELSGRNDMLIQGKKISGIAQSISRKRVLNHGTLMFDVNLNILENSLYVKRDKLKSKGIKSIRGRVTNIKKYLEKDMNINEFQEFLLKTLFEIENKKIEEYVLTKEELMNIDKLYKEKYSKWDWNYGKSPKSQYENYKRLKIGSIEIRFDILEGKIKNTRIYGDFFGAKDIKELEEALIGVKYIKEDVAVELENINLNDYFGKLEKEEFIDLMFPKNKRR